MTTRTPKATRASFVITSIHKLKEYIAFLQQDLSVEDYINCHSQLSLFLFKDEHDLDLVFAFDLHERNWKIFDLKNFYCNPNKRQCTCKYSCSAIRSKNSFLWYLTHKADHDVIWWASGFENIHNREFLLLMLQNLLNLLNEFSNSIDFAHDILDENILDEDILDEEY